MKIADIANPPLTATQAERQRKKLKSVWSEETRLSQQVLIRCLALLEKIAINTKTRPKRKRVPQKKVIALPVTASAEAKPSESAS